jgi:hypothetical protein
MHGVMTSSAIRRLVGFVVTVAPWHGVTDLPQVVVDVASEIPTLDACGSATRRSTMRSDGSAKLAAWPEPTR